MTYPLKLSTASGAHGNGSLLQSGDLHEFVRRARTVFYPLMFKADCDACEAIVRRAANETSREQDHSIRYRRYRLAAQIDRISDQYRFATRQPTRKAIEPDAVAIVDSNSERKIRRLEQDAIAALHARIRAGLTRPYR